MNEVKSFGSDYAYYVTRVTKAKSILEEIRMFTKIRPDDRIRVLAIGAKFGFIEYALSQCTHWNIMTSDIDVKRIGRYQLVQERVQVMVADCTHIPIEASSVDLVILNHVLEHIVDVRVALAEIQRVLCKGGYVYIATPNIYRLYVGWRTLLMRKKGLSIKSRMPYHLGFGNKELCRLLASFSDTRNVTKAHARNSLKRLGCLVACLPQGVFNRFAQSNVFVCRK